MKSEECRVKNLGFYTIPRKFRTSGTSPHHNNMQKLFQVVPVVVKNISKYPHFKNGNFVKSIIISSPKC